MSGIASGCYPEKARFDSLGVRRSIGSYNLGKRTVRERAAIEYHRDTAVMTMAQAVEHAQKQRGGVLPLAEYAELELTAIAAMYMVLMDLSGFSDDPARQERIMEAARKLASEKMKTEFEVEALEADGT